MSVRRNSVCVLVSGGVDSAVLVAELLVAGREVHPLYVRCGLRWEDVELAHLRRYLSALRRRTWRGRLMPLTVAQAPVGPLLGAHWSLGAGRVPSARSAWDSVFLPGRNLILILQAGLYCWRRGVPVIAQAVLKGNPFSDATVNFRRAMERALREGLGVKLRVEAPYARRSKDDILRRVPGLPLHLTLSCLRPRRGEHCERCNKCEERRMGFFR